MWLDKYLKGPILEDSSASNMVNGRKYCSKLNHSTFTLFIDSFAGNSGWKSLCGLFVNPLTANDKYSLLNIGNLLWHFQMPLSQKRKLFAQFFFYIL